MQRVNFWLTKTQISSLKTLPGTVSEHIRRAIDEYLNRLRGKNVASSASKEGE